MSDTNTPNTPITPVVETPAVVETPVVAPQTPVEATPSTPAPVVEATPVIPSTVLGEALEKTNEQKDPNTNTPTPVAEASKEPTDAGKTNTEGGQSENPAPPPKYDPFTIPEGVTLDDERVSQFTNILSDLELKNKVDHSSVQELGQKLVNFHLDAVKKSLENVTKIYKEAFENQKTAWKDAFMKDPEIGGNRFQTTVDSALNFIRTHGGTPEQQAEFKKALNESGLGNHPAMIRLLANAGKAMSEGTPLAAPKPAPQIKSKTQTLYGKS